MRCICRAITTAESWRFSTLWAATAKWAMYSCGVSFSAWYTFSRSPESCLSWTLWLKAALKVFSYSSYVWILSAGSDLYHPIASSVKVWRNIWHQISLHTVMSSILVTKMWIWSSGSPKLLYTANLGALHPFGCSVVSRCGARASLGDDSFFVRSVFVWLVHLPFLMVICDLAVLMVSFFRRIGCCGL